MGLVLVSDIKGLPTGYELVPAGQKEYEPLFRLDEPGRPIFVHNGRWGRDHLATIELSETRLITPHKHRLDELPPAEIAEARIRLVFSSLQGQMRLEDHLAKTLPGLAQRIAQRLLALTLGTFCNLLAGSPARGSSPMTAAESTSAL